MSSFDTSVRGGKKPLYDYGSRLYSVAVVDTVEEFYENETEGRQRVNLMACNRGASEALVTLYLHNTSAGNSHKVWADVPLAAKTTVVFPFTFVLLPGWKLSVSSSVATVNFCAAIDVEV